MTPADGRGARPALTTIYFLLTAGDVSRWHRVMSDEVWHFYEGDPLELAVANVNFETVTTRVLGPFTSTQAPVCIVSAGDWQAARSLGAYTLVGCSVGPGFDFTDFELLRDRPRSETAVLLERPDVAAYF